MTSDEARAGFNHNHAYHRYLLRQVPPGCDRALDAGCGTGLFARRLSRYARQVDAIDRDPAVIAAARAVPASPPNVDFIEGDLAGYELGESRYGFIGCIAVVHHLPFEPTIRALRAALAPGGVLAIIGCYRNATPADYARDLAAIPANKAMNALVRARVRRRGRTLAEQVSDAPVMEPQMTLPQIRGEARPLLPGARVRRRLYWRYSLIYRSEDRLGQDQLRPADRGGVQGDS